MNGRQESDRRTETNIKNMISTSPSIIHEYYYYLSDKTSKTKKAYIQHALRFLDYIDYSSSTDFQSISTLIINQFIDSIKIDDNGKQRSQSWIANIYYGISNFFDFLVDSNNVNYNICKKIKAPKNNVEKEMDYLTEDDIKKIKYNIRHSSRKKWKSRDMAIFLLGCGTGLRVSSISEIDIDDIDFDNNKIIVTEKGNKTRPCFLPDKVMIAIKIWICDRERMVEDNNRALFISQKKQRMSVSAIEDMIKKFAKDIGKHITPHTMRHTFGTIVYEDTGDLYLTAEAMGHKNIKNTMIYAKVSEKKRKEAAAVVNSVI